MYSRRSPRNVKLQCWPIRFQHFIMNNYFYWLNLLNFHFDWRKPSEQIDTYNYAYLKTKQKKHSLFIFLACAIHATFIKFFYYILQLNFTSLVFIEALLLYIYSKDTRYKVMWLPFITYRVTLIVGLCVCKTKGAYHTTTNQSATTTTSASWMMPAKSRVQDV